MQVAPILAGSGQTFVVGFVYFSTITFTKYKVDSECNKRNLKLQASMKAIINHLPATGLSRILCQSRAHFRAIMLKDKEREIGISRSSAASFFCQMPDAAAT